LIANDRKRSWELYDLEADPDEMENLASKRSDTAVCLAALLRVGMTESRMQLAVGDVVDLSPEDESALRSLGYLR
jgi:hypothetical protein